MRCLKCLARGLFVFNFHPDRSYTDYRVGHSWNEGLRLVLDSDAKAFGGQDRLRGVYGQLLPALDGWDSRQETCLSPLNSRDAKVQLLRALPSEPDGSGHF